MFDAFRNATAQRVSVLLGGTETFAFPNGDDLTWNLGVNSPRRICTLTISHRAALATPSPGDYRHRAPACNPAYAGEARAIPASRARRHAHAPTGRYFSRGGSGCREGGVSAQACHRYAPSIRRWICWWHRAHLVRLGCSRRLHRASRLTFAGPSCP
jgi:hypothetical protein